MGFYLYLYILTLVVDNGMGGYRYTVFSHAKYTLLYGH